MTDTERKERAALYLARIGCGMEPEPTLDFLKEAHYRHAVSVPYENLDIVLGTPLSLDGNALFDKIVHRRRGGYCFELNGSFGRLLRAVGFPVEERFARFLRGEAEKELSREADWVRIPAGRLSELPKPIGARAVLSAAEAFGTRLGSRHAAAVLRLAAEGGPSASLDLPGGLCARRRYGELLIGPKPEPRSLSEAVLTFNGWTELPEAGLRVFWGESGTETKINGKFTTYFFKKDRICGKITVRPRMEGDVLRLSGGAGSVKKRMIDGKIPAADRALVPVFSDEKGVIAVFGLGADLRAAAAPSEADAVLIVAERT